MQTYAQFKTKLRARIWPGREPGNLIAPHDAFFQNGMLDLQKWVKCLRDRNTSTYESAVREWDGAKTRILMPRGIIRRVYTVAGGLDRWRDKVYYRSSNIKAMDCWARNLVNAATPPLPDLGYGVRAENASSDWSLGRARQGIWAEYRGRLYVAPWLQTTELLVIEWDGPKQEWMDSDGVDPEIWGAEEEAALETYVLWRHEKRFGDLNVAKSLKDDYDKALAELMYWCLERTRQREDEICSSDGGTIDPTPTGTNNLSDDDDDPTTPDTTDEDAVLFCAVGDLGDTGSDAAAVAAAIASDNPEVFLALGDLSYNGNYATDFDPNYGRFLTAKKLIPVVGNHDLSEFGNSLTAFKAHFDSVLGNNGQNYEAAVGSIHFLIYNSEDTDGIDVDSAQAEWLRAKLLLSTARWKIVLMHKPPYSSDATHGSTAALQLPFKDWGADLVIAAHGHDYERLSVGDFPYIVVGTGGHPLYSFTTPVNGSQVRYNSKFGRLIGEANCDAMVLTFKTVDGDVIDTLTITK